MLQTLRHHSQKLEQSVQRLRLMQMPLLVSKMVRHLHHLVMLKQNLLAIKRLLQRTHMLLMHIKQRLILSLEKIPTSLLEQLPKRKQTLQLQVWLQGLLKHLIHSRKLQTGLVVVQ